ncbi:MAG: DUF433 domain-containing protein, partial [Anaerolineae bacterium]
VATLAVLHRRWGWEPKRIAEEYGVAESLVSEGLAFYEAHRAEIDAQLAAEQTLAPVQSVAR